MGRLPEGRHLGEKEGGQPCRTSGKTGPKPEEHRIDLIGISPEVEKWFMPVKKAEETTKPHSQWPRMPKVPMMLKGTRELEKFYEPRVISFGPYHHGKSHLHQLEMIKRPCAKKFLDDSNQDIKALYTKISRKIKEVRNCYDWSDTNQYDDEALARMMLLDGCFILYVIHCLVSKTTSKFRSLNIKDHIITFVHQDLFLLENQLPFGVLKLLFEGAKFNDVVSPMEEINKFVIDTAWPERTSEILLKEPSHLLDHLRSALLGGSRDTSKQRAHGQQGNGLSFRHIKEVKATGIYLKPSKTSSFRDISFNSYGYLKLPPITIDGSTKARFLNMVAYEMCPEGPDDYGVTSYICFLDNLIDQADDVKELRSRHSLSNFLGSDEEVAKICNEITNDLVDPEAYGDVKASIQEHYDKRVKILG